MVVSSSARDGAVCGRLTCNLARNIAAARWVMHKRDGLQCMNLENVKSCEEPRHAHVQRPRTAVSNETVSI
jgi:hypothetical protein